MRFRSLAKWDDRESSKVLIYIAQLIDELLFDYTLDTYKPSAMNTALLIGEAVSTIKAIESGVVLKPNLRHVLDELCENLKNDEIAKELISVDIVGVTTTLQDRKASESSVATVVELLHRQIPLSAYKQKNQEMLYLEVMGSQDINKIRKFTRSYITTLLNSGYSSKHIEKESQKFFFYSKDRITDNAAILDYFELFSKASISYDVLYRAPSYFLEFLESAKYLGIKVIKVVSEEAPLFNDELVAQKFQLGFEEVYLWISEVSGKEPYVVKAMADKKIETIQTLIGLYHHKESPKSITECLVRNSATGKCYKVAKLTNPMHKCHDATQTVASKKLSIFMKAFALKKESFNKFHRSAELHSLALASESIENQMINLWIALESLIPSKDNDDIAQIEHISNSVMPFLNLEYIRKILTRFSKDLLYWNRGLIKSIYKRINAQGVVSKTAHLLALPEYEALRSELESSFGDNHLLRDRYEHLVSLVSSPKKISTTLDVHAKRVAWQLRRIYRARNMIVHDGSTPSYTEVLIENTHDYLDTVMKWLMALASSANTIHTVSQGFKMMELNYISYKEALSEKNIVFNKDNVDLLLFKYAMNR